MTPERWQRIEEIFQEAVDMPPEARASFLDESCKSDPSLKQEVQLLLAQDAGDSIQKAVLEVAQAFSAEQTADFVGRRIGPYRLTRLIGQGGMGAVYEAVRDDDAYKKQVAVKVIKRGMDTDLILQRFRYERQILATLEHPYIATLFDGGSTEEGLPFLVMEYIDGQPVTQYCDAKNLGINDRLKLFQLICQAVQHAHRNLVVHRDIKPSNILVTEERTPKLLDFGIAKLLNPDSSEANITQTLGALPMLTPDYASPEQVRGQAVSTSTDIYSLGVVLYELLTGQRPYQFKKYSPDEIEHIITATQPERPSAVVDRKGEFSSLHRQLKGDLDNIILMALRKEPERRYGSVEQFSEDIRRHLEGRPIIARKDTVGYRTSKFIGRHKISLGFVTLIILSLVAGIITSVYQARRAERRFQQVRKVANTFLFEFHDKIQNLPGSTEAREMVVKTALEYLDSLANEADNDPSLQLELAIAFQKVGDVQGNPWGPNLGHTKEAMISYKKSLALAKILAERNSSTEFLRTLATGYFKLGALQSEAGEKADAGKTLDMGLAVAEEILQQKVEEKDLILVADILTRLGDVQLDTGDASSALRSYQRMQKFAERRAIDFPTNDAQGSLSASYSHIGESQSAMGDLFKAIESYRKSLSLVEPLVQKNPTNQIYLRYMRVAHTWLGHLSANPLFINKGDKDAAVQHFQSAVDIAEKMTAIDPKNARAQQDLAIDYGNLADILSDSNPWEAAKLHRKALDITDRLLSLTPNQFLFLRRRAYFLRGLGSDLKNLQDDQGALNALQESCSILEKLSIADSSNMVIQRDFHVSSSRYGDVLLDMGRFNEALGNYRRSLSIAEKSATSRPLDLYAQWQLADSYSNLGNYYAAVASKEKRIDDWRTSREWYQKSLNIWNDWPKRAVSTSFNTSKREQVIHAISRCDAELSIAS